MNRAFLVYGPESSGNRLMTRILCGCGCYGDGAHGQRLNSNPPPVGTKMIAWHRSVPYAKGWPDLTYQIDVCRGADFRPHAIVLTRDWYATANSQFNAPHVDYIEDAYKHIERAYRHIFDAINRRDVPYTMVSYESLSQPGYLDWLLGHLGLALQKDLEPIENRNVKYYGLD